MVYAINASPRSFYIHWPFCPYRCNFCPFVALAGQDNYMGPYHEALMQEIAVYANQLALVDKSLILETIFLGGGTPSTYPLHFLKDLFLLLKEKFDFAPNIEITIEVNPGTVTEDHLKVWQELGINRMSVGVQSLKDTVLQDLNRLQTYQDVITLFSYADRYIQNISIDLILGLPGVQDDEWKDYLGKVVSLNIQHISIYFLTVHEDTPLYFKVAKGVVLLPSDERIVELYYWTIAYLESTGFVHYELSNFARKGLMCRHNMTYWSRKPYKAFGLGACSFDGSSRFQNEKNLLKYFALSCEVSGPVASSERLNEQQVFLEKIMLQMRCMWGISLQELHAGFQGPLLEQLMKKINDFCVKGFLVLFDNDARVRLAPRGLVLENQIITQLLL